MSKTKEKANNLIEGIALNKYRWSNECGQSKRVGGKFDVDALTLLATKMDAMTQKLDRLNVNAVNSCTPSPICDRCGSHDHVTENCQVGNPFAPSLSEHVAYVNNYQPRWTDGPDFNFYNPS